MAKADYRHARDYVARAIYESRKRRIHGDDFTPWSKLSPLIRHEWRQDAEAAMAALDRVFFKRGLIVMSKNVLPSHPNRGPT